MLVLDIFGIIESYVVFDCCWGKYEFLGKVGYFTTEKNATFDFFHRSDKHVHETADALSFFTYHQQSFLGLELKLYIDDQPKIVARVRVGADRIFFYLQLGKFSAISTNSVD